MLFQCLLLVIMNRFPVLLSTIILTITANKRKKRDIAALVDYSWFHHNRAKRSNDEEVWCTWECTTDVEPATSAPATGIVLFEVTC